MELQEQELIKQLNNAKTKEKAFEYLVDSYSKALYWKIRTLVLTHDDANDVLQNVWIKVWNNLESYKGEAKISTWMFRIAINESITFLNKEKLQLKMSDDEFNGYIIEQMESDTYFDGDEAWVKLQKAILTLPEKQRLVFQMKYFQELKYSEMSEILNTSEGALKASYHHAVKKIEEFLSGN